MSREWFVVILLTLCWIPLFLVAIWGRKKK
jgi:hypothetical protein